MRPRVWALVLLVCVVAFASPATRTSDTPIASEDPPPRFATGGPGGKSAPSAISTRSSGAGSSTRPSRLVRVAEPRITWTSRAADLTLDDYLSRNPTTGLLIARGDTIFVER
jgi:hypothetical protein